MLRKSFAIALVLSASLIAAAQQFGPWSTPVNLGPIVNGIYEDYQPFESRVGPSLYFARIERNLTGAPQSIFVSKWDADTASWGAPVRLGPAINGVGKPGHPFVTIDGHWLLFNATTPDAANDIYVSRRYNKTEDLPEDPSGGWQAPVNLGPNVNSTSADQSPWIFQDDTTGTTTLYFGSDRSGHFDIYSSTLQEDGTFTAATPVWELNNPDADDQHPTVSRDGLEMYFISNRSGSNLNPSGDPSPDIWVSIRSGTLERWGTPVNLDVANAARGGALINSDFHDGRPALSFDGTRLYFFSANRIGNESNRFDIWVTTREKLQGGRVKQPMVK